MKTNIRKVTLMFFIAITLVGCSKDTEPCDPNDEESPCYAGVKPDEKLLLIEQKQSDFTYKYTYDDRNGMIRWDISTADGKGTWSYTYDGNDRLTGIDIRDGQGTITGQYKYSYGKDDRPVSGTFGEIQIQFTYGQDIVIETHTIQGQTVSTTTYFYNSKGNLLSSEHESILPNGNYLGYYSNYDNKPNSHRMWPSIRIQPSVNNYTSFRLAAAEGSHDHVYEYTYNAAGYPEKADIYHRESEELVTTRIYTYKKAN